MGRRRNGMRGCTGIPIEPGRPARWAIPEPEPGHGAAAPRPPPVTPSRFAR